MSIEESEPRIVSKEVFKQQFKEYEKNLHDKLNAQLAEELEDRALHVAEAITECVENKTPIPYEWLLELAEYCNSDIPTPPKPIVDSSVDDAPEGATHYRNEGGEIFYHNVESGILRYWIHEYGYWAVVNDPAKLELWSKELTPIT